MIAVRSCLLMLVLLHLAAARVIEPARAELHDEDYVYAPRKYPHTMGRLMQMAYNQSIPIEAIRACEQDNSTACPSPSADGTHSCVRLVEICDSRPHCPGGEDETPVICFFYEMHSRELARLRERAMSIHRQNSHHSLRLHKN